MTDATAPKTSSALTETQPLGSADPDRYFIEKRQRAADKRKRTSDLRRYASKDLRRYKTIGRIWIAYVRLARCSDERTKPIRAAELCTVSGFSGARFHKNFGEFQLSAEGSSPNRIDMLLLATVDQISAIVTRELRREVGGREERGEVVTQAERVVLAVNFLVRHVARYPNIFHVEGVLPREVLCSLSDALAEAIIWNGPATLHERADCIAMARYHTTALVGIVRSGLGKDVDRESYVRRVRYVMVSQIVAALPSSSTSVDDALQMASRTGEPLELRVPELPSFLRAARAITAHL